jgi:hypothetical protein
MILKIVHFRPLITAQTTLSTRSTRLAAQLRQHAPVELATGLHLPRRGLFAMKSSKDKKKVLNIGSTEPESEQTSAAGGGAGPIRGGLDHSHHEGPRDLGDQVGGTAESGIATGAAGTTLGGAAGVSLGATNINRRRKKI